MRIKFGDFEAEGNLEDLGKDIINNKEHDWKKKSNQKQKVKKDNIKLKYHAKEEKLRFQNFKKHFSKAYKEELENEIKSRKAIKIVSFILLFVYGVFFALGLTENNMGFMIITALQMLCAIISVLTSMKIFTLFKNDYRLFLVISIFLIIPFFVFMINN